jgi:hypothetical protein
MVLLFLKTKDGQASSNFQLVCDVYLIILGDRFLQICI